MDAGGARLQASAIIVILQIARVSGIAATLRDPAILVLRRAQLLRGRRHRRWRRTEDLARPWGLKLWRFVRMDAGGAGKLASGIISILPKASESRIAATLRAPAILVLRGALLLRGRWHRRWRRQWRLAQDRTRPWRLVLCGFIRMDAWGARLQAPGPPFILLEALVSRVVAAFRAPAILKLRSALLLWWWGRRWGRRRRRRWCRSGPISRACITRHRASCDQFSAEGVASASVRLPLAA